MVRAALALFIMAIISYGLGANQIGGISSEIGKGLVGLFLALSFISYMVSLITNKNKQLLP